MLRRLTTLSAALLWGGGALNVGRAAARADDALLAHDAVGLRVSRGPWPIPDNLLPGVRFESIRIRMDDGARLAALL